ncbi:hypothetical protein A3Q56_02339 [Intoshia linei]|uniref:Uncharacterized protein n=1 Tax=Intoshia linei TaxID=1819745 RepID=A0A177B6P0_9BILA|nr:hypothetical protein A3Q56_02339 [Intoshia linei]
MSDNSTKKDFNEFKSKSKSKSNPKSKHKPIQKNDTKKSKIDNESNNINANTSSLQTVEPIKKSKPDKQNCNPFLPKPKNRSTAPKNEYPQNNYSRNQQPTQRNQLQKNPPQRFQHLPQKNQNVPIRNTSTHQSQTNQKSQLTQKNRPKIREIDKNMLNRKNGNKNDNPRNQSDSISRPVLERLNRLSFNSNAPQIVPQTPRISQKISTRNANANAHNIEDYNMKKFQNLVENNSFLPLFNFVQKMRNNGVYGVVRQGCRELLKINGNHTATINMALDFYEKVDDVDSFLELFIRTKKDHSNYNYIIFDKCVRYFSMNKKSNMYQNLMSSSAEALLPTLIDKSDEYLKVGFDCMFYAKTDMSLSILTKIVDFALNDKTSDANAGKMCMLFMGRCKRKNIEKMENFDEFCKLADHVFNSIAGLKLVCGNQPNVDFLKNYVSLYYSNFDKLYLVVHEIYNIMSNRLGFITHLLYKSIIYQTHLKYITSDLKNICGELSLYKLKDLSLFDAFRLYLNVKNDADDYYKIINLCSNDLESNIIFPPTYYLTAYSFYKLGRCTQAMELLNKLSTVTLTGQWKIMYLSLKLKCILVYEINTVGQLNDLLDSEISKQVNDQLFKLIVQSEIAILNRDYLNVITMCDAYLNGSTNSVLLSQKGWAMFKLLDQQDNDFLNKMKNIIEIFSKSIRFGHDLNSRVYLRLCCIYIKLNIPSKIKRMYKNVIKIDKNHARIYYIMGCYYMKQPKKINQTIMELEKCFNFGYKVEKYYKTFIKVLETEKLMDKLDSTLEKLKNDNHWALRKLALLRTENLKLGSNDKDALLILLKASEVFKNDLEITIALADYYEMKKIYDKSKEYFIQAQKLQNVPIFLDLRIAQVSFQLGEFQESEKIFNSILSIQKNNIGALIGKFNLSFALVKQSALSFLYIDYYQKVDTCLNLIEKIDSIINNTNENENKNFPINLVYISKLFVEFYQFLDKTNLLENFKSLNLENLNKNPNLKKMVLFKTFSSVSIFKLHMTILKDNQEAISFYNVSKSLYLWLNCFMEGHDDYNGHEFEMLQVEKICIENNNLIDLKIKFDVNNGEPLKFIYQTCLKLAIYAIKRDLDNVDFWYNLAIISGNLKFGNVNLSLHSFSKMLQLPNVDKSLIYYSVSNFSLRKGELNKTFKLVRNALTLELDQVYYWFNLVKISTIVNSCSILNILYIILKVINVESFLVLYIQKVYNVICPQNDILSVFKHVQRFKSIFPWIDTLVHFQCGETFNEKIHFAIDRVKQVEHLVRFSKETYHQLGLISCHVKCYKSGIEYLRLAQGQNDNLNFSNQYIIYCLNVLLDCKVDTENTLDQDILGNVDDKNFFKCLYLTQHLSLDSKQFVNLTVNLITHSISNFYSFNGILAQMDQLLSHLIFNSSYKSAYFILSNFYKSSFFIENISGVYSIYLVYVHFLNILAPELNIKILQSSFIPNFETYCVKQYLKYQSFGLLQFLPIQIYFLQKKLISIDNDNAFLIKYSFNMYKSCPSVDNVILCICCLWLYLLWIESRNVKNPTFSIKHVYKSLNLFLEYFQVSTLKDDTFQKYQLFIHVFTILNFFKYNFNQVQTYCNELGRDFLLKIQYMGNCTNNGIMCNSHFQYLLFNKKDDCKLLNTPMCYFYQYKKKIFDIVLSYIPDK